jgi:RNA polymerase-binding transcription factor DksA
MKKTSKVKRPAAAKGARRAASTKPKPRAAAKAPPAGHRKPAARARPSAPKAGAVSAPADKGKAKVAPPVRPPDPPRKSPYAKRDLVLFRKLLLELRDRVVDGISFLAGENLRSSQRDASGDLSNYGIHMADQGTDNFDHEFALNMVSNEQDLLYEIDEAIHRIDAGSYGVCEMTGRAIEKERLRVLPYARFCREAQETLEKGRKRFRPFGPSMVQTGEA